MKPLEQEEMTVFDMEIKSEDEGVEDKARGNWANQADYVISILGSIIGYGNLWRFPYLCNRHGGGAFLIPFIFFLVTCGLPLFFLETAVGQFVGRSNVHVWAVCPLFKGIGIGQFIACSIVVVYYQTIIAWSIYYMGMSCFSVLPWTTCSNDWNTPNCVEDVMPTYSNTSANLSYYNDTGSGSFIRQSNFSFVDSDVEEFWQHKSLGVSKGVQEIGYIQWHLALSLFVSWLLIFLCLIKGVRSVGKVVYVTALLPYVLLTVLLIRTLLLPGAVDGIVFYIKPDFKKLANFQVWLEALIQVFYSCGPGWGTMIALSSYNKFHDNCLRNSVICTFAGEGTSLYAGFVIFSVLGFMASSANVEVSKVVSSGPGLGFVAYPEGISQLPFSQVWAFLFFVMMITVGLDSQFTWAETLLTAIIDQFPRTLRKRRILVTAVFCSACFIVGLPYTTQGGIYYFQLVDWYAGALCVMIFGILECVVFIWIYDSKNFSDDVELMLGRRVPLFFNILLGYITPLCLGVSLVILLWQFKPPTYGDYVYPEVCQVIGWIIAVIPVLPIPIVACLMLLRSQGSLRQRFVNCLSPDHKWRPVAKKYRPMYRASRKQRNCSCLGGSQSR